MNWVTKAWLSPMCLLCTATLGLAFFALGFCLLPFVPSPVGGQIAMFVSTYGAILASMEVLSATVDLIVRCKLLPVGLSSIALMANVGSGFIAHYVVDHFQNVHVIDYLERAYPYVGPFIWPLIFGLLIAAPLTTVMLFALAFFRFVKREPVIKGEKGV